MVVFRHEPARASFLSNLPLIHPEKKEGQQHHTVIDFLVSDLRRNFF